MNERYESCLIRRVVVQQLRSSSEWVLLFGQLQTTGRMKTRPHERIFGVRPSSCLLLLDILPILYMCYCGSCSSRFCCVLGFDRAKNVYIIVDFEELVYQVVYCFASKAVFNRLQYNYVRRGVLYFGAIFLNFGRPSHPRIKDCFINNYYAKFVLTP